MISSDLRQMFLFCVFNIYTIVYICQLTTDKCCNGRPVTQEVDGASDLLASLRRDCRSRVHLQHWSTWQDLQAGCLWCAGRNVWLSYPGKLSILILLSFHIWLNVNSELRMLSRSLLIPRDVGWDTVYICAGDDNTGSLLDSQGGKMLFHFLDLAHPYAERWKERTNVRLSLSRILLFYSN